MHFNWAIVDISVLRVMSAGTTNGFPLRSAFHSLEPFAIAAKATEGESAGYFVFHAYNIVYRATLVN